MKAIQVSKPGGPEALEFVELPLPHPKAHEAVVEVSASGVNFIDVYFREGRYKADMPLVLGQEGAGVVTSVGEEVNSLKIGDRVGVGRCSRELCRVRLHTCGEVGDHSE